MYVFGGLAMKSLDWSAGHFYAPKMLMKKNVARSIKKYMYVFSYFVQIPWLGVRYQFYALNKMQMKPIERRSRGGGSSLVDVVD